MTDEINMTPEALAALVDARIAEHDQVKQREAGRISELLNPSPTPAPPINAPAELVAELTKALVASRGDMDKATLSILARLNVDMKQRPVDPQFTALFHGWAFARDVVGPGLRAGLIKNLLTRIQRQREKVA